MNKCKNCGKEAVGRSKYCSDKCKVAYNRNKSKTVTPETVTSETVTSVTEIQTEQPKANRIFPQTFRDSQGGEHPIDYAHRRKNQKVLVDWFRSGASNLKSLGFLLMSYQVTHGAGHVSKIGGYLQDFLGLDLTLDEMVKGGYWDFDVFKVSEHQLEAK